MAFPTLEHALIATAIVVAASVGVLAWRNRPAPGARAIAALMGSFVVWNLTHLLVHVAGPGLQPVLERLQWLGVAPSAFLWLGFALAFTRRRPRLSRRTWAVVLAWPVLLNGAIWATTIAGAVGVAGVPAVFEALDGESGRVFLAHVGLSYLAVGVATVLFGRFVYRTSTVFRRQGVAVVAAVGTVWVASVVSVFELFDQAHFIALPLGFVVSGGLFLWAITGAELTDLTPVATSMVLETMDAGVVVVDGERRVVSTNPAARDLFDVPSEAAAVGEPLAAVVGPDLRSALEARDASADGGTLAPLSVGDRTVDVQASELTDRTGTTLGEVYLCTDVTDQHRRQNELERKNDRLDAFASVVSHDLRNPLAVANTNVQLAREVGDLDRLDDAEAALERMDRLIDDLLALSRQGNDVAETTPVRLDNAVQLSWQNVETDDAKLGVETDLTVEVDRNQLGRLLENLFRNAVTHGGAEAVTVGAVPGASGPEGFFVADDGRGIPEGDRDAVLEPGYSDGGGNGLGLAIVSRVAEGHGWSLAVTESDEGGARFEFTGVDVVEDFAGGGGE